MQKRSYYRAGWIKFAEDADMPAVMSALSEKKVCCAPLSCIICAHLEYTRSKDLNCTSLTLRSLS